MKFPRLQHHGRSKDMHGSVNFSPLVEHSIQNRFQNYIYLTYGSLRRKVSEKLWSSCQSIIIYCKCSDQRFDNLVIGPAKTSSSNELFRSSPLKRSKSSVRPLRGVYS